jgi:hypothetical protein
MTTRPKTGDYICKNRAERRVKNKNLFEKIRDMRYMIIGACGGKNMPKIPRERTPKYLSGYYSQLCIIAREAIK